MQRKKSNITKTLSYVFTFFLFLYFLCNSFKAESKHFHNFRQLYSITSFRLPFFLPILPSFSPFSLLSFTKFAFTLTVTLSPSRSTHSQSSNCELRSAVEQRGSYGGPHTSPSWRSNFAKEFPPLLQH